MGGVWVSAKKGNGGGIGAPESARQYHFNKSTTNQIEKNTNRTAARSQPQSANHLNLGRNFIAILFRASESLPGGFEPDAAHIAQQFPAHLQGILGAFADGRRIAAVVRGLRRYRRATRATLSRNILGASSSEKPRLPIT